MKIRDHFPALASRDFTIFWVGQFLSLIGTWMQNTTQPYLAYRLTGRPFDLGLIGFAATLPTLILALPGGVIVEQLNKRKVVIVLQTIMMLQAFMLAILTLTGLIQIWHIILLASVLGAANAVETIARQAMLIELVGRPALPNAIALQTTIFNAARVLGPSLTAVVLVLVKNQGEGWAFLINGISFLFVIIGLTFVRTPFRASTVAAGNRKRNMMAEFKEGQRYILGNATVGLIILMAALIGLVGFPFTQQIPVIARDVLKQASDTETIVKARNSALYLAQGFGALTAALYLAINSSLKRKGLVLTIGQFVFAIALLSISIIQSLPIALVMIVVIGWAVITQMVMMNTLIQLDVPDTLRGRVFSTYLWGLQGVAPFGSLFVGWMAQNWGVPRTALVSGGICMCIAIAIHAVHPGIRQKIS